MSNVQKKTMLRGWGLRGLLLIYDAFVVNLAYFVAVIIRFSDADSYQDQGAFYMGMFKSYAPWYTCAALVLFILFRLYNGVWRYAGFNDAKRLVFSNICSCILYVCGSLLIVGRMPITVYGAGAAIQLVLMGIPRLSLRYLTDILRNLVEGVRDDIKSPVMIIGICENTGISQKKLAKDKESSMKPVCVVDYAYGYRGNFYNGLPVFCGPNAVSECIEKYNIRYVIFAADYLPDEYRESVRALCEKNNIELSDFVIETTAQNNGIKLGNLLETVGNSDFIIKFGSDEHKFSDAGSAVKLLGDSHIIENVSVENDTLCIRIKNG